MEEFKGDKRTKEYKEWKAKYEAQSKGLGDTIEKITEATGVKKLVKWALGEDCGCDERKEKLNEVFKYRAKPKCLNEDEYHFLNVFFQKSVSRGIPQDEWKEFLTIYNRVFEMNIQECSSCGTVNQSYYNEMKKVFNTYK